jgi:nicotinate-nucleotide adenylyltransferase
MQIGVFGGSFDPPHLAHLALARRALAEVPLDTLLWVPAGQPWQKDGVSAAHHRLAMVELMLAEAGEARFRLEPLELQHQGPSYMVDTLAALQARPLWAGAQWWVLLGQDQYARLHTWHRFEALLPMANWLVAARQGQRPQAAASVSACPHQMRVLELPRMDVSSSAIREALCMGQDARPWLSSSVARYLEQNPLYRKPDPPLGLAEAVDGPTHCPPFLPPGR